MNARICRFFGVAFGRMAAKRTPLKQGEAFLPIPDDNFLISTLVSCFQYLERATRDSGEEKVHAASELVHAAWMVMDGDILPDRVLKAVRTTLPEAVTYPASAGHEFGIMANVVEHYLSGGKAIGQDQASRALILADFITEDLARRIKVSLRLRRASEERVGQLDIDGRRERARAKIARLLERKEEEDWPTLREEVIRAGLRGFGIPQNLFKNKLLNLQDKEIPDPDG